MYTAGGISTGRTPENGNSYGVYAWTDGQAQFATANTHLTQQVSIIRSLAAGGVTPHEKGQLDLLIADVMDNGVINNQVLRSIASNQL